MKYKIFVPIAAAVMLSAFTGCNSQSEARRTENDATDNIQAESENISQEGGSYKSSDGLSQDINESSGMADDANNDDVNLTDVNKGSRQSENTYENEVSTAYSGGEIMEDISQAVSDGMDNAGNFVEGVGEKISDAVKMD